MQEEQRKPVGKQTRLDVWVTNGPTTPRCACLCAPQQTLETVQQAFSGLAAISQQPCRQQNGQQPADGGHRLERTGCATNTANAGGARVCDTGVTNVTRAWTSQ